MEGSKRDYLPMSHSIQLSKKISPKTHKERNRMSSISYGSIVGSIMYTMLCTRLDVAYALGTVSGFQVDLGKDHWKAMKNILKYLRRTRDIFLIYGGFDLKLKGYTNSSFQSDPDDSKSISGYVFTLYSGAISWKNFKQ